jgi:predicted ArsR family transcriptional regulator
LPKKSMLRSILGGAALQRCNSCIVLNAALAAEGSCEAHHDFFTNLLGNHRSASRARAVATIAAVSARRTVSPREAAAHPIS